MKVLSPEYTRLKLAAPHTWHAAEMFLLLNQCAGGQSPVSPKHSITWPEPKS
jgi:hypothetical protein